MPTNYYLFFLTALIPLLIGAIYYHPKVLGGVWMKENGFTEESLKDTNMLKVFGLTYLFGLFISFTMMYIVIHQPHVYSILVPMSGEVNPPDMADANAFIAKYGDRYRTWSHGLAHGFGISLFFVMPIIAINGLFERRSWKYILVHTGYWLITLILIGMVLSSSLKFPAV